MSSVASSVIGFSAGMSAGCDRLVAPSVQGADRAQQRRFVSLLIVGPFALMAAWPSAFSAHLDRNLGVAALVLAFALSWSLVAIVARRGVLGHAGDIALAGGALVVGAAVTGAGGMSSPTILIAAALAFEAWWVMRSSRALRWGALAAAGVAAAQIASHVAGFPAQAATFSPWLWLVPLAYAATVVPRLSSALREELGAARPRPDTAIEDLLDAVVLRIAPGGETIDASGRTQSLLGVAPQLLLGEAFYERVHVADRVALMRALAAKDATPAHLELRVRVAGAASGTFRPFSAELHPGAPGCLILRDNATVEALRADVAAAREQVAGSDVAKARFLAAVSHELRTPLNAIIGFSDMLAYEMAGPFADPRQKEYACLIRDSGNHLLGVVNSILDVSKIESGAYPIRPELFAVAEAAAASHAMLALQARDKSVELSNRVLPSVGEICADRRAVQQILINLLSNAVKFTPRGGSVKLDARRRGQVVTFEVSDTGIGIAADDLARLGRPFVQVHNDYTRQFDGAGLGLSITKGLVALHGGAMSIQSSPGAGTVVTVSLPVEAHGVAALPQAKAEAVEGGEHDSGTFRKSA